jgi:hypothetical protein
MATLDDLRRIPGLPPEFLKEIPVLYSAEGTKDQMYEDESFQ